VNRTTSVIDLGGPVHYANHGVDGPTMVLLHGLGGSHLNWESATPHLAKHYRVLAPDLLGFGLTPLAGRRADLRSQRSLVVRFITEVAQGPVVLGGNSMGGLIAMMTASRHPELVDKLVLVNPALPIVSSGSISRTTLERLGVPLVPLIGPVAVKRYYQDTEPERQVEDTLNLLCFDPSRVPPYARARAVEMVRLRQEMEWATEAFTQAIRSSTTALLRRGRFAARVLHRITAPTLLIHGNADVIVAPASAAWAAAQRPDWTFRMFDGVGHIPMIEVPETFSETVLTWLEDT